MTSKVYRVFKHATGLVQEAYDVEFDRTNSSQEAQTNFDDVGNKPLREVTQNMLVGAIKPKEDEDEMQVFNMPLSLNVTQDDNKYEGHTNEDTYVR